MEGYLKDSEDQIRDLRKEREQLRKDKEELETENEDTIDMIERILRGEAKPEEFE